MTGEEDPVGLVGNLVKRTRWCANYRSSEEERLTRLVKWLAASAVKSGHPTGRPLRYRPISTKRLRVPSTQSAEDGNSLIAPA